MSFFKSQSSSRHAPLSLCAQAVILATTVALIAQHGNNNGHIHHVQAFTPPSTTDMTTRGSTIGTINTIETQQPKTMQLYAIPTLDNWEISKTNSAIGRVSNHPSPDIFDGEMITTSPLSANKDKMKEGQIVSTSSGSKYRLGKPKYAPVAAQKTAASKSANVSVKTSPSISFGSFRNWGKPKNGKSAPAKRKTKAIKMEDWFISFRGELIGVVQGHPDRSITDGDTITTSKIEGSRNSLKEGDIVTTTSGSDYILGTKKKGLAANFFNNGISSASAESKGGTFKSGVLGELSKPSSPSFGLRSFQLIKPKSEEKKSSKSKPTSSSSSNRLRTFELMSNVLSNKSSSVGPPPPSSLETSGSNRVASNPKQLDKNRLRALKQRYGINGKTLANGKYLLCDRARRSTSGKSNIWSAYKSDANGNPIGEKLTIKVSTNFDAMTREDFNYNRVCSGLFPGRFVEKSEFLEDCDGYPEKEFETSCALVIENGRKDLRAILNERGLRGFEGRAMRDAASAALQCIQAMHSSGIVWTDLKTENFVIVSDEIGDNGMLPGVKGIDLESAIKRGKNPVDFSPEACPPEFATAFISGQGLSFKLDYSYDMWSYGMMLFELTTGRPYFDGKTPAQITMSLQYEFEPDLSSVTDDKLRDLIGQCLRYDPKKRPGVAQLLLHPYFLSTGIGPFGW